MAGEGQAGKGRHLRGGKARLYAGRAAWYNKRTRAEGGCAMNTTKERIRQTACRLFSERGYRAVSMRAIADEMGISVGNLTYHYPHKEQLLEAVMDAELDSLPTDPAPGLDSLHTLLRRMLESFSEAPFYFTDPALQRESPRLQRRHARNVGRLYRALWSSLALQVEAGLMDPALRGAQRRRLALLLMTSHVGWAQHNATWAPAHRLGVEEMLACQWAALTPYLTEAGRAQWAALAAKKNAGT